MLCFMKWSGLSSSFFLFFLDTICFFHIYCCQMVKACLIFEWEWSRRLMYEVSTSCELLAFEHPWGLWVEHELAGFVLSSMWFCLLLVRPSGTAWVSRIQAFIASYLGMWFKWIHVVNMHSEMVSILFGCIRVLLFWSLWFLKCKGLWI